MVGEGDHPGIIPRMNDAVFEGIAEMKAENEGKQFVITVSYLEIYNEVIE